MYGAFLLPVFTTGHFLVIEKKSRFYVKNWWIWSALSVWAHASRACKKDCALFWAKVSKLTASK